MGHKHLGEVVLDLEMGGVTRGLLNLDSVVLPLEG